MAQTKFNKDNRPADNDYSPEAVEFREAEIHEDQIADQAAKNREQGQPTDHEIHGGVKPLTVEQEQEKPGADPAPRHYDGAR